jgi:O-antigen biosynthesis protein
VRPLPRRLLHRKAGTRLHVPLPLQLLDVLHEGPAPLVTAPRGAPDTGRLDVAIVVPAFRRGSGGHATIANLVRGLEDRDHQVGLWVTDDEGRHSGESEGRTAAQFREFFGPVHGPIRRNFAQWRGADVVVATGWQTVPQVLRLPGVRGRAYLVQDHEPEFYATSAERSWAEWTYRQGLHCVCASPWLAELVGRRYEASASSFDLGVDHEDYRPPITDRRDRRVLFYARAVTARRGVPLGLLALTELHRRQPDIEIALFGEAREVEAPFPYMQLGILEPADLARAYISAMLGLVLSLTNPSLVPTEMLACGLPVVDVASESMIATFGAGGPVVLVRQDPISLCDGIEALIEDAELRAEHSRAGIGYASGRTWSRAAEQVEDGLRTVLDGSVSP